MCNCINCPNATMSFSSTRGEMDFTATLSYKFTCKALGREIANVTNPKMKFPAPADCPMKDEDEKDKTFVDKMIEGMIS